MSRTIVSASVPTPLGERLREIAAAGDRTVSYTLTKLIERALENDNGASAGAAVKIGQDGPKNASAV